MTTPYISPGFVGDGVAMPLPGTACRNPSTGRGAPLGRKIPRLATESSTLLNCVSRAAEGREQISGFHEDCETS